MKDLINKLFKTQLTAEELATYRNKPPVDNFDGVCRTITYDYLDKPIAAQVATTVAMGAAGYLVGKGIVRFLDRKGFKRTANVYDKMVSFGVGTSIITVHASVQSALSEIDRVERLRK